MEINTNLPELKSKDELNNLIDNKSNATDDVKRFIDIQLTKTALEQEEVLTTMVEQKSAELRNDAEAKKVEAETKRINEEVKRITAEKEKEIAEFDKIIQAKQKEVEKLKTESDEAEAYFEANKDILKYALIRTKKSLNVMKFWLYPASVVFLVIQILMLPITFCGMIIENIINIIGGISGELKNNALKIVVSVIVILVVLAILVLTYIYGGKFIKGIYN